MADKQDRNEALESERRRSRRLPRTRAALLPVLLVASLMAGFIAPTAVEAASSATTSVIVKVAGGLSKAQQQDVVRRNGGQLRSTVPALNLLVVNVPAAEASSATKRYQADRQVNRVDADRARKAAGAPSDPAYTNQWSLPKIGWDAARDTATPAGSATIAVLDTGVDINSAELTGRTVAGWSAFGTDPNADPHGHGTWLASIAAAETDNAAGIAGVAFKGAKVMPVQVLAADGTGQDSDVIAGVMKAADAGADVILMGFSNPGFSQSLQDAVDYAWAKGAVLVAATGNAGSSEPTYPAGDAKVVGVSATDQNDALWSGSNYGASAFLGGPGTGIVANAVDGGTTSVTGTSASAAVVAGAAAVLKANDATASPGTIVGRLARNADPAGTADQTGNGRVNLARALADTSTTEVVPAGAAPTGDGGPFVGPYVAAAQLSGDLQGQNNPPCSSGGICPWQTSNLSGWAEQQEVPLRLSFVSGQTGRSRQFDVAIDHSAGGSQGLGTLYNWVASSNVTMSIADPRPVKSSNGSGAETWTYSFTATMKDNHAGEIRFKTRLSAGANSFTGASLQVKESSSGTLGFTKPAAAPGIPDLVVEKAGPSDVVNGQRITYSLAYKNIASGSANNATAVVLKDELPSQVTYVSGSCTGACTYDATNKVVSWSFASIPAGGPSATAATATYQVDVGPGLATGSTFTNNASIYSNQAEASGTTANNNSSVTSTVRQNKLVFTTAAQTVNAGTVSNTITVQAQDFNGAALVGARTVNLATSSGTGAFKDNATGSTTITSVSIPSGGTTASFKYVDTTAGAPTLIASSTGLASAQQTITVQSSAGISGTVYDDLNGNGVFDTGEVGLANVPVTLNGGTSVTTATNGSYSFTGLAAGTYLVDYTVPNGFANTGTRPLSVTVAAGQGATGNNLFAQQRNATISGAVYNDSNGNGAFDTGEVGQANVPVTLSGEAPVNTDTNGNYSFTSLAAGTYLVDYTVPNGFANTGTRPLSVTVTAGQGATGNNFFARKTTATALAQTVGSNPSTYGDSVTWTATVTSAAGNPNSVGTVTFKSGSTVLCSAVLLSGNTASCSTSTLAAAVDPYSITAEYSGTTAGGGYAESTSSPISHTITKAASTVVVSCDPASVVYTGSAQTPCSAELTGAGLTPSALPVTYTDNINVGTVTVGRLGR